jgi:N-methylhydantoinase A/oxoprolinase/acetone carboxylase beta subunit
VEKPPLAITPAQREGSTPPEAARRESRDAYWDSLGGYTQTPVFVFEALRPGNTLLGPVLIEAKDTTYVIGPEWRFTLDFFYNGLLEKL